MALCTETAYSEKTPGLFAALIGGPIARVYTTHEQTLIPAHKGWLFTGADWFGSEAGRYGQLLRMVLAMTVNKDLPCFENGPGNDGE